MGQTLNVTMRYMIKSDIPAAVTIENSCSDDAWPYDEFESLLKQRTCLGVIAEYGQEIVGFLIYELIENRIEVLNLAVVPHRQREGIGSTLIEKLFTRLSELRPDIIFDVSESNLCAQLFLQWCDFYCTDIIRELYDNGESAYRFRYNLFGSDR